MEKIETITSMKYYNNNIPTSLVKDDQLITNHLTIAELFSDFTYITESIQKKLMFANKPFEDFLKPNKYESFIMASIACSNEKNNQFSSS